MIPDLSIDYLTCGGCGHEYPLRDITSFIQHKSDCHDASLSHERYSKDTSHHGHERSNHSPADGGNFDSWEITQIGPNETMLSCFTCSRDFLTARGLLHHVQLSHNLKIFIQRDTPQPPDSVHITNHDSNAEPELHHSSSSSQPSQWRSNPDQERTTVEINQNDGTVKTNLSQSCAELAAAGGTTICCNSKECCVTIIPGTHERPKKCCSAIVPKKRRCHMELHMSAEGEKEEEDGDGDNEEVKDESFDGDDRDDSRDDTRSADAIFIDFRPREEREKDNNPDGDSESTENNSWGTLQVRKGKPNEQSGKSQNDQRPFALQPGMTFSIPMSFSSQTHSSSQSTYTQSSTSTKESVSMYNLPPRATFSVGTSNIMTISSVSTPYVMGSRLNMGERHHMQERDFSKSQERPRELQREDSVEDVESEDSQLMIDMDSDVSDRLGNDDMSPDKSGKKRRYPTSRPYKCDQCDHAFNQRIHLKKHMSKHTGVKPFKCQQCDYSTVERSHLKVHIRIHTGEKPYKCTYCEYATAQNSTLKIHVKRHHGAKLFECPICKKTFSQNDLLHTHQEEHHQNVIGDDILRIPSVAVDNGMAPSAVGDADRDIEMEEPS